MTIQRAPIPARSQVLIPNKPKTFRDTIISIFGVLLVVSGLVRAAAAFTFVAYLFAAAAVVVFSLNLLMIVQRHSMILVLGSVLATAAVFGLVLDTVTRVLLIVFVI